MIQKTRAILGVCFLLLAGFCVWQALPANVSQQAAMPPAAADSVAASLPKQITHTLIEQVRIGQRVLAHNPEVTDEQRSEFDNEPTFEHWVHLKLEMPKQDGGILHIELLRPLEWVESQLGYVVRKRDVQPQKAESRQASNLPGAPFRQTSFPAPARRKESSHSSLSQSQSEPDLAKPSRLAAANHHDESQVPLSPLQPVFYRLAMTSAAFNAGNADLVGLTVELNLPELGARGTAIVTEVLGTTPIESKTGPDDTRRVVTATFRHPPSNQILDVSFVSEAAWQRRQSAGPHAPKPETQNLNPVGEADTVSVTENHLFWSVDQQEFVEVGRMEVGERVQTFHGETKRIDSKLPRPGPPEEVFNLEVYGEHVYFVGDRLLLAHNMCPEGVLDDIINNPHVTDTSFTQGVGRITRDKSVRSSGGHMQIVDSIMDPGKTLVLRPSGFKPMNVLTQSAVTNGNARASEIAQEIYLATVTRGKFKGLEIKVGITQASIGIDKRLSQQVDHLVSLLKSQGIRVTPSQIGVTPLASVPAGPGARGIGLDIERAEAFWRISSPDIGDFGPRRRLPGHLSPRND